jgi:hypothetical protein
MLALGLSHSSEAADKVAAISLYESLTRGLRPRPPMKAIWQHCSPSVVVAAARHVDATLTPDIAVNELKNNAVIRNLVRDAIVNRAPERMIAGGRPALAALIDDILDAWIETADEQAAGGNAFIYARKKSPHRLLHMPLDLEIGNLAEPHRRFVAGRSMRDVEPNVTLKVRDPYGNMIANADDLA